MLHLHDQLHDTTARLQLLTHQHDRLLRLRDHLPTDRRDRVTVLRLALIKEQLHLRFRQERLQIELDHQRRADHYRHADGEHDHHDRDDRYGNLRDDFRFHY